MQRSRAWLFRIAIALGLVACAEGAAAWGLRFLARNRGLSYDPLRLELHEQQLEAIRRFMYLSTSYYMFDAGLGWTLRPSSRHEASQAEAYRTNAAGLRGVREYLEEPPPAILRVAAFGDSFTHGDGEGDDTTWPASVERLDATVEVLNYGVSGYGLDQAFLRYQAEGERFHPRVVVIAFMIDDIGRQVSAYRLFLARTTRFPFAKPRFQLEGAGLRLVPSPMRRAEDYTALAQGDPAALRRIGQHDSFFQAAYLPGPFDFLRSVRLCKIVRSRWTLGDLYGKDSEALAVTTRLMQEFIRLIEARGARPLVAVLPGNGDLASFQRDGSRRYAPLIAFLEAHGVPFVDLVEPLARAAGRDAHSLFNRTAHYSASGNRVVAETLLPRLRAVSHP